MIFLSKLTKPCYVIPYESHSELRQDLYESLCGECRCGMQEAHVEDMLDTECGSEFSVVG